MTPSIKKLVQETVRSILNESYRLEPNMVPSGIRSWVESTLGKKVMKYDLEQRGEVSIGMPVYEGDREEYQLFRLEDGGQAVPVNGVRFYRAGNEGDGVPVTGHKIDGRTEIPSGHVLVRTSRMFNEATIFTAGDAMKMLMPTPDDTEQLSDMELLALYQAKSLKSAYRHKFAPAIYDRLIALGLLAANRSVTNKGRNLLELPVITDRLGGRFSSSKLDHLIKPWLREGISPEQRAEAVEFAKGLKQYLKSKYGLLKLGVKLSKSVSVNPFITIVGKDEFSRLPEPLIKDCLVTVYGPEKAEEAIHTGMGNIRDHYIAMGLDQWKTLMGQQ